MGKRGPRPGLPGYKRRPILDRLWEKTIVTDTGCWEFQGKKTKKGYARISVGSRLNNSIRPEYIHILSWERLVGSRDKRLTIDHLCENKACWNPDHLEEVTNAENKKRAGERMTHCRRGHERNITNTYVHPTTGKMQCRVCKVIASELLKETRLALT